jgi:hypothetical protein
MTGEDHVGLVDDHRREVTGDGDGAGELIDFSIGVDLHAIRVGEERGDRA